ncbi:antibiotic biosynthesis monooxygenase [Amycolatopsis sp. NBC_00345]|uniref:antibiotic biosynthesis monooxygenase family protein n=1 Tax=Amycolatopsis sp. NBC_00345 TaxID=2975955 RepID=UPI002E260F92
MPTTTIDLAAEVATLLNVFTVDPARQRELVTVLETATETVMRHQPGFISANIHASLDGTRVANYSQWSTVDAFQAMLANPECIPHLDSARALAHSDPHMYTVESIHHV